MVTMKPTTRVDYARRILRVLVHIQQNLDRALPLEDLASVASFSPFHFHRVFRGMVGETVMQHVRRLRLERAAMQLKHGRRPVTSLAYDAGYETPEAFSRAFRNAFGRSPSAYRAAGVASGEIAAPAHAHFAADGNDVAFQPLTLEQLPMDVQIRTIDPMRVAFMRHVGPYDQVAGTWEHLCDWAGRHGLIGPDTRLFGACYDDPEVTPPDKIRYDACISVDGTVRGEGTIGIQTLAGARYAVVLHEGPYENLGETYGALYGRWFAANRSEPGPPPSLEFYLDDPDTTPPEDRMTELCVRIQE